MKNKLSRRNFLNGLGAGTMGLLLNRCNAPDKSSLNKPEKKIKVQNDSVPKKTEPTPVSPTVAVIQSEKSNVWLLSDDDIRQLVHQAIELAGGFDGLIHDGDTVVLKPNLMCLWLRSTAEKLQPESNGVTTDWRVTRAVVELVRKYNPTGKVYVMESSAFQCTELAMKELKYTPEFIPGVDEFLCLETCSGEYEEWNSSRLRKVYLPENSGLYPDSMKPNKSSEFYFNKLYYEADVLISLPVLKNHTHTGITGALKNVAVGGSPPTIYGQLMESALTGATAKVATKLGRRLELNRWYKINHKPLYLDMWIHDYYLCRPVDFVVTDGLNGLENGPDISKITGAKSLEEHQMNMRLILAGRDALAVDTIHSLLIGMDPAKINHLVLLQSKNVGCIDSARIRVKGAKIYEIKKTFVMNYERAAQKMYSQTAPPEVEVQSVMLEENRLQLKLGANPRIIKKVEIAVDDQMLSPVVLENFHNMNFDVAHLQTSKQTVSVYAYDAYLNCTQKNISIAGYH